MFLVLIDTIFLDTDEQQSSLWTTATVVLWLNDITLLGTRSFYFRSHDRYQMTLKGLILSEHLWRTWAWNASGSHKNTFQAHELVKSKPCIKHWNNSLRSHNTPSSHNDMQAKNLYKKQILGFKTGFTEYSYLVFGKLYINWSRKIMRYMPLRCAAVICRNPRRLAGDRNFAKVGLQVTPA